MIITIDGPAASGKSSAARCLAQKLGFYYLYSGLLYRGCAYVLLKAGFTKKEFARIDPGAVSTYYNVKRIRYLYTLNHGEQLFFDGADITAQLKTPKIDEASSLLAENPAIREAIRLVQQEYSATSNIVADGRDMGTVVFPHAQVKFFLTASVEARAQRWQHAQKTVGNSFTIEEATAILTERDHRDTIRDHSPLAVARDAIMIDNTNMSAAETCQKIEDEVKKILSDKQK
jgi:CMP/dCMP kinase